MSEWKYRANYADIQALRRVGWWSDKQVPAWAQERADFFQAAPTSGAVLESAYVEEIERLQGLVDQLKPACEYLETALRDIVRDCVQCPDTAQYACHVVDGLTDFGDVFARPPITVHLSKNIRDYNACFKDIFDTLERFVDNKVLDEMSWRPSQKESSLIDVSPLLSEHAKIYDCIQLVVSYWEEKGSSE